MSIAAQIIRIQNAKASIKSAIEAKLGSSIPNNVTMDGFSTFVTSAAEVQYASGQAAGGGGGGQVVVGSNVTISDVNSDIIDSGNTLVGKGVASGYTMNVSAGGIANNTFVFGGTMNVIGGTASGAKLYSFALAAENNEGPGLISAGFTMNVGANGTASSVEAFGPGKVEVNGTVNGLTGHKVSAYSEDEYYGGTEVYSDDVTSVGFKVNGTASNVILEQSKLAHGDGGIVNNINISSNGQYYVGSSSYTGTCVGNNVVISGGSIIVRAHGELNEVVMRDGYITCSSGGRINGVVVSGGTFYCSSGCYVNGIDNFGGAVYYNGDTLSNDVESGGTVIYFSRAPELQVYTYGAYGGQNGFMVSGITYPAEMGMDYTSLNGLYVYNSAGGYYKHQTQNYYLGYSNTYNVYVLKTNSNFEDYMYIDTNWNGDKYIENGCYCYCWTGYTGTWQVCGMEMMEYYGNAPTVTDGRTNLGGWHLSGIDGASTWRNNGDRVSGFSGWTKGGNPSVTVVFKTVNGYTTPSNVTLTLKDRINFVSGTYA